MASNVEGKFQYLIETKELIKGALNEKGLAISDADTFRSYADSIRNAKFKSDDVRYVTFMNGTRQLYVKPVATGDDCVDVKAKGWISTPTKASSASTVYTYAGWAATNGGAADADVLKAVKEDKTVYAAYTESVRYYTITYYDSDGTTVLKTESLAYGSTPSYAPTKDGYDFDGWTTAVSPVTGNASYTAKWTEKTGIVSKITIPKSTYNNGTVQDMAITNDGSLVALACGGGSAIPGPVTLDISGDTVVYSTAPAFSTALYCGACDFNYNDSEFIIIGNANSKATGTKYSISDNVLAYAGSVSANLSNRVRYSPVSNDYVVAKGTASFAISGGSNISTSGKIGGISAFECSPDGKTVAVLGASYSTPTGVCLYDMTNGSFIRTVTTTAVNSVSYNSDGSMLAVCYYSGDSRWVSVYDTSTWTEICNLEGVVTSACKATFLGRDTLVVANGSNVLVYTVTDTGLKDFEQDFPTYSGGSISNIRSNHTKTHVMFLNSNGLEIWQKLGA